MSEDQLQPEDTLDDRGVGDVLDEGYSPPEELRGSKAKGTTPYEQVEGETIEDRLRQEEPDTWQEPMQETDHRESDVAEDPGWPPAGDERSGRLVAPDEGVREDDEEGLVAEDEGIAGAGASAEEAAVHTIDEEE